MVYRQYALLQGEFICFAFVFLSSVSKIIMVSYDHVIGLTILTHTMPPSIIVSLLEVTNAAMKKITGEITVAHTSEILIDLA